MHDRSLITVPLLCFIYLVFGSEKRSSQMPVPVSCVTAAQNSLWVGTENGVILSYPFSLPNMVAEETGWEVIKVRLEGVYMNMYTCTCTIHVYMYVTCNNCGSCIFLGGRGIG